MRVKYVDIAAQHLAIRDALVHAVDGVWQRGDFVLENAVEEFEHRIRSLCATRYGIAVANGTDALVLTMKALHIGPGDEVITVPNSFLATAGAIALVGARPVFVDVQADLNIDPERIEAAITPRSKAVLPVHLTGRPADMRPILEIANQHGLFVIEDAAQAIGAHYHGQPVGSFGIGGCFSLHPLKNLNACGDGGVITTNDRALSETLRKLRNHGLRNRDEAEFWGHNSRLDTLQAAILNVKLDHLGAWTEQRRRNAAFYQQHLAHVVDVPVDQPHEYAVYHTYVIQCNDRDRLQAYLVEHGIETKIHYPIPIHLQEAARDLGYRRGDFPVAERQVQRILSLPISPEMTEEQKAFVVSTIREFYS